SLVPPAHTPQRPEPMQKPPSHATVSPHCPALVHVCTPLPEHRVTAGEQTGAAASADASSPASRGAGSASADTSSPLVASIEGVIPASAPRWGSSVEGGEPESSATMSKLPAIPRQPTAPALAAPIARAATTPASHDTPRRGSREERFVTLIVRTDLRDPCSAGPRRCRPAPACWAT